MLLFTFFINNSLFLFEVNVNVNDKLLNIYRKNGEAHELYDFTSS